MHYVNKFNVAVVGATGMVGRKMLQVLEERKFPVGELYPFASPKSAGKVIKFRGRNYKVLPLTPANIEARKIDLALFSAGADVSDRFAPIFAERKIVVVDNSSRWRTDPEVPLVVPEVNAEKIADHNYIIANPNCSTIQAVVALAPIHKHYGLKRVVYTTFQAVSGAGMGGYEDLENGVKGMAPKKFPKPIFGNCLPHIDKFLPDGYTKEEEKMIFETKKILGLPNLKVTATCVRVPVYYGHSESINIETEIPAAPEKVRFFLGGSPSIKIVDSPEKGLYPTPLDCANRDEVFVGRIRADESVPNGLNMWVVADNIRKGAATNAVQIAEILVKNKKLLSKE